MKNLMMQFYIKTPDKIKNKHLNGIILVNKMSTEFIHTIEFFETIFCFSLLLLIGQQAILIWKRLDDKYIRVKFKQFEEQEKWLKRKLECEDKSNGKDIMKDEINDEKKQSDKPQPPKEENLRTSLVDNENDQTDRKIAQNNSKYIETEGNEQRRRSNLRKSLTDLRKQQIQNEHQVQIKDDSSASYSRKPSLDSKKGTQTFNIQQNKNNKKSTLLQRLQQPDLQTQQPSINYSDVDSETRKQVKTHFKIEVLKHIDAVFDEHLPILMPMIILGIIVHSTYIFTIVCFFGYIFSHLLLNYTSLQSKKQFGLFVPKIWVVAIFISYWSDSQFS